jgi:hypothetical protein
LHWKQARTLQLHETVLGPHGVRNRVGLPLRARTLQVHSKFHRCNVNSASRRVSIPKATRRAKLLQGCWWVGLSGAGSRHYRYQQMLTPPPPSPLRWQYSFLRGPTPGSLPAFRLRSVGSLYDSFPDWRSWLSGIHNTLDVAGHCKRHLSPLGEEGICVGEDIISEPLLRCGGEEGMESETGVGGGERGLRVE